MEPTSPCHLEGAPATEDVGGADVRAVQRSHVPVHVSMSSLDSTRKLATLGMAMEGNGNTTKERQRKP